MLGIICKKKQPTYVVDITNPTWQSILGNYFISQTDELTFGGGYNAWGGLINPTGFQVNMYFDIFTITNFSGQPFTAEIWINPCLPGKGTISSYTHPANLTITPPPKPKVMLIYDSQVFGSPKDGVNVFDRIVPPNSTLISDSSKGGIIIPPGGSFVIFLRSPGPLNISGRIVLTWWEEKIRKKNFLLFKKRQLR